MSVEKSYLLDIVHSYVTLAILAEISANRLKPDASLFEFVTAVWARARKDYLVEGRRERQRKLLTLDRSAAVHGYAPGRAIR